MNEIAFGFCLMSVFFFIVHFMLKKGQRDALRQAFDEANYRKEME